MMGRVACSGIDVGAIAAISGSAQQHGSVYLNTSADAVLASLDARTPLVDQLRSTLARETSPIWMDSSTTRRMRGDHRGSRRRAAARTAHRLARVRALHRTADPELLQTLAIGLRAHRPHSPRELVSCVAACRSARAARSRRRLRHEPDGSGRAELVASGSRGDGAGVAAQAAGHRDAMESGRHSRAILADSLRLSRRARDRVDGRQPLQL